MDWLEMRLRAAFPKAIYGGFALAVCFWTGFRSQQPPSKEAGQPTVLRKSTGVLVGSAVKRIEPDYPDKARQQGISGKVVVQVTIDERGDVISASPISGPDVLRDAAARAARRWKFKPTFLSGVVVRVVGEINFNFEFDETEVGTSSRGQLPHGRTVSANSPMLLLSERERRGLNKRLDLAAPMRVTVGDQDGASISIAGATIRSSRLNTELDSSMGATPQSRSNYAIKADLVLLNRSDQRVVSAGLQFVNTVTDEVFLSVARKAWRKSGSR